LHGVIGDRTKRDFRGRKSSDNVGLLLVRYSTLRYGAGYRGVFIVEALIGYRAIALLYLLLVVVLGMK